MKFLLQSMDSVFALYLHTEFGVKGYVMRLLWFLLSLSLILDGCAHTNAHTTVRENEAPNAVALASIKTIGVIPAAIQTYNKNLSIHESLMLKSMGERALSGALTGFFTSDDSHTDCNGDYCVPEVLLTPIFTLVGGISGAVSGVTNPKIIPVIATEQQSLASEKLFAAGIQSVTANEHILQHFLVDDGNKLTSYLFIPVDRFEHDGEEDAGRIMNNRWSVDAHIRPSHFQILLSGKEANDQSLSLIVNGHFTLSKSGYPDNCLGWYSSTWKGSRKALSSWSKNDAELLKQELNAALAAQSYEAITYLFNSEETRITHHKASSGYPDWLNCYEARHKKIKNYVRWYCPGADRGFAESQRYIGDLYYESGINDGAVNSFLWYSLAAAGNDPEAANRLSQVRQELSPEQLTRAEIRLRQWRPGNCASKLQSVQ